MILDHEKIIAVPNFDSQFRNVSYHEAEQIYHSHIRTLTQSTSATPESVFYDICDQAGKQSGSPRVFTRTSEGGQEIKVCLIDRDANTCPKNVHVVGVLDCAATADLSHLLYQCASKVVCEQHFRLRLIGFTLRRSKMRTFLFDRGRVYSSDEFDIALNPVRLVRILTSCLRMTKEELGYDPSFAVDLDGRKTLAMEGTDQVYELGSSIYSPVSLRGRSTAIWKAKRIDATGSSAMACETIVIKDCWKIRNRKDEGEFLKQVAVCEASLFPPECDSKFQSQHHLHDWPKPQRYSTYIHHRTARHGNLILNADDENAVLEHRRVVVKYVDCQKIEELNSLLDIFTAIRDCVDGHWALYRAGLLHRGVSKDNLMAAMKKAKGKKVLEYGFIIDLDFTADTELSTRAASGTPYATGNIAFMAREVLQWLHNCQAHYALYQRALCGGRPGAIVKRLADYERHSGRFKQDYRHDLESFYWVLLWCLFKKPNGEGLRNEVFQVLVNPKKPFKDALSQKVEHFTQIQEWDEYFERHILSEFTERWEGLEPLLVSFSGIFSSTDTIAKLPAVELYCKFQHGLTEMIDFLREE